MASHRVSQSRMLRCFIALACVLMIAMSLADAAEEVRRFDTNKDGKIDQWEYFLEGLLVRVELDRNHDGRVDEWTFYEQGKIVKAEFDTDRDGTINQREFYDAQGQVQG